MKIKKNLVLTITLAITLVLGVATVFVANSTKDVTIAEIPKLTEKLFNLDNDMYILTNALAEQYYFECINHIEKNNIYFTLLK